MLEIIMNACTRCGRFHTDAEAAAGHRLSCTEVKQFWSRVKSEHRRRFGHSPLLTMDGEARAWKCLACGAHLDLRVERFFEFKERKYTAMPNVGIAMDLGTSGFRGQALDLDRNRLIMATALTTRHPLPGANVMDHLHFALEAGVELAHEVVVAAVNRVIAHLPIDPRHVRRLAVCGNPIQLSLFQAIEIRDLAYAGRRKLDALGVVPPARDAKIVKAGTISGLDLPSETEVVIPPAVQHEIGADALAMMIQTSLLTADNIAVATDYGTNNEMALIVNGVVYTGSTAAGPALEGQHIEDGLLALPGAISDVAFEPDPEVNFHAARRCARGAGAPSTGFFKTRILNHDMRPVAGDMVRGDDGSVVSAGVERALGITGTGVVALISEGLQSGHIRIPAVNSSDGTIHLPDGVGFSTRDLLEAGKAIGAVRAGHITLCHEAGIDPEEIEIAYCSGASGTYVDALKAQAIGMIPPNVKKIYQVGNTSLAMARDLVCDGKMLARMKRIADRLRRHHCMFASSKAFEKVYILELAHWTEGMAMAQYRQFLARYGLPDLKPVDATPRVVKTVERDIQDPGMDGLRVITDLKLRRSAVFEQCGACGACVSECPEAALKLEADGSHGRITVDLARCNGVACRRCERACEDKIFNPLNLIRGGPPGDAGADFKG